MGTSRRPKDRCTCSGTRCSKHKIQSHRFLRREVCPSSGHSESETTSFRIYSSTPDQARVSAGGAYLPALHRSGICTLVAGPLGCSRGNPPGERIHRVRIPAVGTPQRPSLRCTYSIPCPQRSSRAVATIRAHAASTCSCRTVVCPITSRKVYLPASFVCVRNIRPSAFSAAWSRRFRSSSADRILHRRRRIPEADHIERRGGEQFEVRLTNG